jgi:hypothetical protein
LDTTIRILLQTTTPARPDDWSVDSLTLLRGHLAGLSEEDVRFEVTACNRETPAGVPDLVLSRLDETDFDELWLFALDSGDGLTPEDCAGITRFRQRGGGILTTRDHQDMGSSLCSIGGIGLAHHFQTKNPEPDTSRRVRDDAETRNISWPNYHSGSNGDFQRIVRLEPAHELLRNPESPSGWIEFFPAHPHEGAVDAPPGEEARVIAQGTSRSTGRRFNLAAAFERRMDGSGHRLGRGIAESSFHHFADYNWDPSRGCPSFVTEPAADGMRTNSRAASDIRAYVRNLARWLAPESSGADESNISAQEQASAKEA